MHVRAEPHEGFGSAGFIRQDEIATGVVTTASLSVRQIPDNGGTIGAFSNDSEVHILAEQSDCLRVGFDDDDGCVDASHVERRQGSVTASSLNLRDAPDGGRIGALARGTDVSILTTDGKWLEVDADGQTGWVSADFIEEHVWRLG